MHALVYTDKETLEYKEFKNPTLAKGESIIKVHASGTVSYTHLTLPTKRIV